MNYADAGEIFATAVNAGAPGLQPADVADIQTMTVNLAAARAAGKRLVPGNGAQESFLTALAKIIIRANGLTPIAYARNNAYNILIKSSNWWNTDHWALGLNFGLSKAIDTPFFVQTVPNQSLRHSCSVVWDEHLPGIGIGIVDLHQNQVDQLSNAPFSDCRINVVPGNRQCTTALAIGSGQCRDCGFVLCAGHLSNASPRSGGTYVCSNCLGTVERLG